MGIALETAVVYADPVQGKTLTYVRQFGDEAHTPGAVCPVCQPIGYPQADNCRLGFLHAVEDGAGVHRACDFCGTDE